MQALFLCVLRNNSRNRAYQRGLASEAFGSKALLRTLSLDLNELSSPLKVAVREQALAAIGNQ